LSFASFSARRRLEKDCARYSWAAACYDAQWIQGSVRRFEKCTQSCLNEVLCRIRDYGSSRHFDGGGSVGHGCLPLPGSRGDHILPHTSKQKSSQTTNLKVHKLASERVWKRTLGKHKGCVGGTTHRRTTTLVGVRMRMLRYNTPHYMCRLHSDC